jgi:hypothetical protein
MANHLVNFKHKLPAAKDFENESVIVWLDPTDQNRKGDDYREMLLVEKLKLDPKKIVLFESITRL